MNAVAAGGVSPSWVSLERKMIDSPGQVVELARMPAGLTAITDMKLWSRKVLDKWITHILRGQRDPEYICSRFQFREVPAGPGHVPRVVRGYEATPHPSSKLVYTTLETLYGVKLLGEAQAILQGIISESWEPLPKARSTHIYPAYTGETFRALRRIHADEEDMCALIEAVARLER